MSGNHFLLTLTEFVRNPPGAGGTPVQYDTIKFKVNWEGDTVEATQNAAGDEGNLPYQSPAGSTSPSSYDNVPIYIDGNEYLVENAKYPGGGNGQVPYGALGIDFNNTIWVTFDDGQRVHIETTEGWQFALVTPASGGPRELLIGFPQSFMNNLVEAIDIHGQPVSLDAGYNLSGGGVANGGNGVPLSNALMNSKDGAAFPCFVRGTTIETEHGAVAVEDLHVGDMVLTCDHGFQAIRWVGSRLMREAELTARPNLQPIRIRNNALGPDCPQKDLMVSPQHRILVRSKIARRMFSADEVLIAAKNLLSVKGVETSADLAEVEYFHILFDRHEVVLANGAQTESLYTGPEALKSLDTAAREEIFTLFPELRDHKLTKPARPLGNGGKGRKLGMRHTQNAQTLQPRSEGFCRKL